jgi:two-component system NtrC family sensor kinase
MRSQGGQTLQRQADSFAGELRSPCRDRDRECAPALRIAPANDLQEALEYQTATSDVLKVISRSVFELNTVLQTVIASAVNLCRAERAILYRYRDGHCHFEVGYNNDAEYEELERSTPIAPSRESLVGRTMLERRVVQIVDAWNDPEYGPKDDARLNDVHSMLARRAAAA